MQKITPITTDLTEKKIDQISRIFPNVITEKEADDGSIVRAVDFDLLRQELSKTIVEDENERYRLDWPGKKASILKANTPINKTLRPIREESVNFDTTENLYIEGDNFEALKILQESYLGKVKMIYIDPPYNTGKDFVYKDNFSQTRSEYEDELGILDEEGGRLVRNTDTNGRFHSDWLSMMYERLIIARDFLADDGVIFISIDDNEAHNLRKICDDVFGEENFIAQLVWEKKKKGAFLSGAVTNIKEYVIVYSREISTFQGMIGEINSSEETYPVIKTTNSRGVRLIKKGIVSKYKEENFFVKTGTRISSGNMELILLSDLEITDGKLAKDVKVDSNWIYSQELLDRYAEDNSLYITQDLYFRRVVSEPRTKMLKDILPMRGTESNGISFVYSEDLFQDGWGTNEDGFDELHTLFGIQSLMSFPKPSKLLAKLLLSVCRFDNNAIVFDFFSGSATTAHAVMQLNAEDGGRRRFIMVQIAEETDEQSEAYKAGYKTISDIGKERIRRAGAKILEESKDKEGIENLDVGFRVFRVDDTNMADVARHPTELSQETLLDFVENIKPDRTPEDLLIETMLGLGLTLDLPIVRKEIDHKVVFFVEENSLVACFEADVDDILIDQIAKSQPLRVVFRDSSFQDDKDRINLENRFKSLAPDTVISVI